MNKTQITIIYKVLSKIDNPNFESLVNTFAVQDAFNDFKLDVSSLRNLHEVIKDSSSLDDVLEIVNPSKKTTKISTGDVKLAKKSKDDKKRALKDEAKAMNFHLYISDYQIVGERSAYALQSKVKSFMKSGWVPWGGSTFGHPGAGLMKVPDSHFQVMVKFKY
tara:strand:+ start:120 stop:608 length:489 start_codon:yes stop_codon:yes gene_type:complete